ncbi:hypothetical protein UFOVP229_75 [uncultured Caudovirales phage]|uniref:Uncharacterized protein n=1 Tax=uncultured Caudovirales phage TaxID=2100421 RepID=A0A6J7WN20_9CAUD|nr:hypothetical protein UFOVP229_75 [uncultured Caudovirales phage]
MALNGSGPISLGGSTTGQSVNLELGQSATATISFNDANVRTLTGTTAGASLSMPGGFWGKSNTTGFSNFLYGSNGLAYDPYPTAGQPLVTPANQLYVFSRIYYNGGTPQGIGVQKIGNDGSTIWKNIYYGSGSTNILPSSGPSHPKCALDSSGNVYFNGYFGNKFINVKLDTDGNVAWGKSIDVSTAGYPQYVIGSAIDSAGNLICAYQYQRVVSGTYNATIVCKFDASGILLWQKEFGAAGNGARFGGLWGNLVVDSSNNIYVGGAILNTANQIVPVVTKLDSSGVFQWCNSYVGTSTSTSAEGKAQGMIISGAGDLYMCCFYNNNTGWKDSIVLKLNMSTGAIVSQNSLRIGGPTSAASFGYSGISSDSSNNIYLVAAANVSSTNVPVIVKYDSTLSSISWQQIFDGAGTFGGAYANDIAINGSNYVVSTVGQAPIPTPTAIGSVVFALPNSGSVTGNLTFSSSPTATVNVSASSYTSPSTTLSAVSIPFSTSGSLFPAASYSIVSSALSSYSNQVRTQP